MMAHQPIHHHTSHTHTGRHHPHHHDASAKDFELWRDKLKETDVELFPFCQRCQEHHYRPDDNLCTSVPEGTEKRHCRLCGTKHYFNPVYEGNGQQHPKLIGCSWYLEKDAELLATWCTSAHHFAYLPTPESKVLICSCKKHDHTKKWIHEKKGGHHSVCMSSPASNLSHNHTIPSSSSHNHSHSHSHSHTPAKRNLSNTTSPGAPQSAPIPKSSKRRKTKPSELEIVVPTPPLPIVNTPQCQNISSLLTPSTPLSQAAPTTEEQQTLALTCLRQWEKLTPYNEKLIALRDKLTDGVEGNKEASRRWALYFYQLLTSQNPETSNLCTLIQTCWKKIRFFWEQIEELYQSNLLSQEFFNPDRSTWLFFGNASRILIEPLDIAHYYASCKKRCCGGTYAGENTSDLCVQFPSYYDLDNRLAIWKSLESKFNQYLLHQPSAHCEQDKTAMNFQDIEAALLTKIGKKPTGSTAVDTSTNPSTEITLQPSPQPHNQSNTIIPSPAMSSDPFAALSPLAAAHDLAEEWNINDLVADLFKDTEEDSAFSL